MRQRLIIRQAYNKVAEQASKGKEREREYSLGEVFALMDVGSYKFRWGCNKCVCQEIAFFFGYAKCPTPKISQSPLGTVTRVHRRSVMETVGRKKQW